MKRYSNIKIIFLALVASSIIVLLIPSGHYLYDENKIITNSFQFIDYDKTIMTDLFMAPINGLFGISNSTSHQISVTETGVLYGSISIVLLVFSIGIFMSTINKYKVIENFIDINYLKIKNNFKIFVMILVMFFGFSATTHGMYETTIPLSLSLFLIFEKLGYNKMLAIKIIIFSTAIGHIGGTINPFATGLASQLLNISLSETIILHSIIFLCLLIITIQYIAMIVERHKCTKTQKYNNNNDEKTVKEKNLIRIKFISFLLPLIYMSFCFLPIVNEFIIGFQLNIFELSIFFLTVSFCFSMIETHNIDEAIADTFTLSKELVIVGLSLGIARGIYIMMYNNYVTDTIIYSLSEVISTRDNLIIVLILLIFFLILATFIPSTSAVAYLTMPILGSVFLINNLKPEIIVTCYQLSFGITKIISPTSVVVTSLLAYSNITYTKWVQESYKFVLMVTIITILITALYYIVIS